MKLFHTSDWHLGRMLYGRSLLEDQRWFLEQVFLPAVEREKPACVLLCGDLYDRQIAPVEAIRLFDAVLSRLTELGVKVCAISGNHDGAVRLDSLFIDEGFGSLDSETLDTAMKALAMLRGSGENGQAGGRLVGIISHVTELKNRIPGRIEISRDAAGNSHAKVRI